MQRNIKCVVVGDGAVGKCIAGQILDENHAFHLEIYPKISPTHFF